METEVDMERDILCLLKVKGTPHLTEKILNLLDARSLANAELVCTQWRSFIADERCWKKFLLSKEVTSIPNIISYWAKPKSGEESGEHYCKSEWLRIFRFYQKLEANWRTGSCGAKTVRIINEVICFSMNATKIFTAEYDKNKFLIKTWNRNLLYCEEQTFQDEGQWQSVSMDCDNDILVTASIKGVGDSFIDPNANSLVNYNIIVREIKTGKEIKNIVVGPSRYFGQYETAFKVRVGHGLLISHHHQLQSPPSSDNVVKSRLDVWQVTKIREEGTKEGTNNLYIEVKPVEPADGAVPFPNVLISTSQQSSTHPIFIGHDKTYIVVHYNNPPRFEVVSTSSLNLTRTIDAFDYCPSAKFKDGLIVSGSTGTSAMIRLWDVETGSCLREIREPWICSDIKLVGLTANYLVTVPGHPDNREMKIRDLSSAMANSQTSDLTFLATREVLIADPDSWLDRFIVDDFQLVNFQQKQFVVYSFAPEV
ncbi:F-box and WD repeat domain-containing 11-B-like isoform X2 [Daphnia pulex]|uniref:F-box and WD repeat domain-containing 11-B-like isoform X2 n=1 Tax=Daphnia pulex TaxID=6669 RepID=UPI001EE06A14|nr:F-box and WD repeat domain-containing 11-B-like isoform X2 [Daphnia pulex]